MKIQGLIFKKINEEFQTFAKSKLVAETVRFSEEQIKMITEEYEERVISDSLKKLHNRYPDFYKTQANNQAVISKEMEDSFRYFFAYINTADQVYESIREFLKSNDAPNNYKFILPQYGLLVRLADQIGVMLLNGYPDGALRIWRSFYEYSIVTLLFIKEIHNDTLQRRFIDHFYRSKKRKSESFQEKHKELNFPPLEEWFFSTLKERIETFNNQYGKDFLEDEYGWCNDIFNTTKRVTLRDIEKYVEAKRFRPFYICASGFTHPGFESMLTFFDEDKQMIILNEINTQSLNKQSFIDPMQLTVGLFHDVNVRFLEVFSHESEYAINVLMFRKVFETLLTTFDGKLE